MDLWSLTEAPDGVSAHVLLLTSALVVPMDAATTARRAGPAGPARAYQPPLSPP
jgi:hypothetical protein